MNHRSLCLLVWLWAATAGAQDGLPPPEYGGDPVGAATDPPAGTDHGPSPAAEPVAEEPADAWTLPRVMVLPARRTPRAFVLSVMEIVGQTADAVASDDYIRDARGRGLPPESRDALAHVLPDHAVDLVIEVELQTAGDRRRGRAARWLRVRYREGSAGALLLEELHPTAGDRLEPEVAERLLAELRLSLAVVTKPQLAASSGSRDPELGPAELPVIEEAREERSAVGAAVHVGLAAAGGVGTRSMEVPTGAGEVRLETSLFPAAALALEIAVEPEAMGRLTWLGELRYLTSVGLQATDRRLDGSLRETSSRSQSLRASLGADYRLAADPAAPWVHAELGYALRAFSSEAPVTLPDYVLAGGVLRVGAGMLLFDGRLEVALTPEVQWILSVGEAIAQHGVKGSAPAFGGELRLRFAWTLSLSVEGAYRESHALLGDATDVERYGTLGLLYRP